MSNQSGLGLGLRVKYSFYSTLVFVLVTNPTVILLLQKFFGGILSNDALTPFGYFIQISLFFLIILGLMMFPKDTV